MLKDTDRWMLRDKLARDTYEALIQWAKKQLKVRLRKSDCDLLSLILTPLVKRNDNPQFCYLSPGRDIEPTMMCWEGRIESARNWSAEGMIAWVRNNVPFTAILIIDHGCSMFEVERLRMCGYTVLLPGQYKKDSIIEDD